MKTEQIVITTRNRNLGYGWTNQPRQHREFLRGREVSYLAIEEPVLQVRGGLRTIERERDRALRINRGNDWREALFVGARRVVDDYIGMTLAALREYGSAVVDVAVEE